MRYEKMFGRCNAPSVGSRIVLMLTLWIALCAVSCKTVKTTTQTTDQSSAVIQNAVQATSNSTQTADTSTHIEDGSILAQDIDEIITETEWSVPDSMGKQYPIKTIEKRRQTHSNRQNAVATTTHIQTTDNTQSTFSDSSQSVMQNDIQTTEKTKTKVSTPAWVIVSIIALFAVILIVILVVLRHYRII